MFLYQNDIQIKKKLEKTEKKFQSKMRKDKNFDKKKNSDKKSFEDVRKTEKLTLSFN